MSNCEAASEGVRLLAEVQRVCEEHLEACDLAVEAEELGEVAFWPVGAGPYCGCQTCVVREVLAVVGPYFGRLGEHFPGVG